MLPDDGLARGWEETTAEEWGETLQVGLKADGWHGSGLLVRRGEELLVVPSRFSSVLGSARERPVPVGEVTLVVPFLALPWGRISLQLGNREAAVVPFWKRRELLRLLTNSGRTVKFRRTLVLLAVGR